ncbi:hypothetical protein GCM10028805_60980 [Spirosoma harenae]
MTVGNTQKIVIVIPIYKSIPNHFEELSFVRCLKVLKRHSLFVVYPENVDLLLYDKIAKKENVFIEKMPLPEGYFIDIYTYSKLLTSIKFYNYFISFDYMLIYQLDAYVFTDDLIKWMQKDYDFIGAPISEKTNDLILKKFESDFGVDLQLKNCFLNGGFSLRKIQACINAISYNEAFVEELISKFWPEDVIFLLLFNRNNYNLPHKLEAIKFSFESFPKDSFKLNNNKLPTGCHAWYRNDFDIHDNEFWFEKIIPTYFYKLKILNKIHVAKKTLKYYIEK